MNLLILEPQEFDGKNYHITGRKKEHILAVWKLKQGEDFPAGKLNESYGIAKFIHKSNSEIILDYTPLRTLKKSTISIQVYSAFQRPQTTKKLLQLCATCGVRKILFFPFDKSEKAYETSSLWKNKAYEQELILGLEQGKRVEMPIVEYSFNLKQKINFQFPQICFLLDLEGKRIFEYKNFLDTKKNNHFGLILGPEAGITKKDREFFIQKGTLPLNLSNNILRSEFALAFALSQLELVLGSLD